MNSILSPILPEFSPRSLIQGKDNDFTPVSSYPNYPNGHILTKLGKWQNLFINQSLLPFEVKSGKDYESHLALSNVMACG